MDGGWPSRRFTSFRYFFSSGYLVELLLSAWLVNANCGIGCWRCSNGACDQCSQAWIRADDGTCENCGVHGRCEKYSSCASGFISKNGACLPCAYDCAGCLVAGEGNCDEGMCAPNFALALDGQCKRCPKHCVECDPTGTCIRCEEQFMVAAGGKSCQACIQYCFSCSSPDKCDEGGCGYGFGRSNDGTCGWCSDRRCARCDARGPGTCDAADLCNNGRGHWTIGESWTLDDLGKCRKCSEGCDKCDEGGPDSFDAGHCVGQPQRSMGQAVDSRCVSCPHNCLECSSAERCEKCIPGGDMRHPERIELLAKTGICVVCARYCSSCQQAGGGRCDEGSCVDGFGPSQLDRGLCIRCPSGCRRCAHSEPGHCEVGYCKIGLGIAGNGSCLPCARNCEFCAISGAGSCDTGRCAANFENRNDHCEAQTIKTRARAGTLRKPSLRGRLVLPLVLNSHESEHCVRLIDLETGALMDEEFSFCMPWSNTLGLQCSFDAHRGVFYLHEDQFLRRISTDDWQQMAYQRLAARLDMLASDPVLGALASVLTVVRMSYAVSVKMDGSIEFWKSSWHKSGFWGYNTIAAWMGYLAVPTFRDPLLRLHRDKLPDSAASQIQSWAAIRFDEESNKLYAIGRKTSMHDAKESDPLSLYELQLSDEGGIVVAANRCRLLGLHNVFQGDHGSYSFLARGRLHVLGSQSANHVRNRLFHVDVRTCEMGWMNWSFHGMRDWTCLADRAALLEDGLLHPLHDLPKAPEVPDVPKWVPASFGCFEHPEMNQFMLAEHAFLTENNECMTNTTFQRTQRSCYAGSEQLQASCAKLEGQVCTATVRSELAHRQWVRTALTCLPAQCLSQQLAELAARDDFIYRWCPTLPFLPGQFLYNCKLSFHDCKATVGFHNPPAEGATTSQDPSGLESSKQSHKLFILSNPIMPILALAPCAFGLIVGFWRKWRQRRDQARDFQQLDAPCDGTDLDIVVVGSRA